MSEHEREGVRPRGGLPDEQRMDRVPGDTPADDPSLRRDGGIDAGGPPGRDGGPLMSCPRHDHLPSPWVPADCEECHPPRLSGLMPSGPMGTTSATAELLSDIAGTL